MRVCGCQGRLVPRDVLTRGMGGTTTLVYVRDDCLCIRKLEASSKNTPLANNDISLAAQVAFITTGCTYTTCANALQLLGIKPVNNHAFMKTLETLHPIVEAMVNAMCEREKQRMKDRNQEELGSWKRWMTRGFHSKNAPSPFGTRRQEHCSTTCTSAQKAKTRSSKKISTEGLPSIYKSLPSVLIFSCIGTLGSSYRTPGSSYRTLGNVMYM